MFANYSIVTSQNLSPRDCSQHPSFKKASDYIKAIVEGVSAGAESQDNVLDNTHFDIQINKCIYH